MSLCLLGVLLCASAVHAVDKSGVKTNTISLPKGPGSIEGLGEAFQPTLNTGTAKYTVALSLPPGTAGHGPELSLYYEGGSSNGPLGFGWVMKTDSVSRQTDEGTPHYIDSDVFLGSSKEELVPLPGTATSYLPSGGGTGYYLSKIEGSFVRYQRTGATWESKQPDGTLCTYGQSPDSRIDGPGGTYSWLIDRCADTNGNVILYEYQSFAGTTTTTLGIDPNANQRYLKRVSWGPGAPPWTNYHFVTFTYDDRDDWFEDCRQGFPVRTGKRVSQIVVGTHGPTLAGHLQADLDGDGQIDNLDRRYDLTYVPGHWSVLQRVQPFGADGISTLPASTFGYRQSSTPATISAAGKIISTVNEPPVSPGHPYTDFLDINGDGLPDLLQTFPGGGAHRAYLNLGEQAGSGSVESIKFSGFREVFSDTGAWNINLESGSTVAHLADMDGDGISDLVYKDADGQVHFFKNNANQTWGPRVDMGTDVKPPSPFGTPNVRNADMNFDKKMDVVQAEDGITLRVWYNLGGQSFAPSVAYANPIELNLDAPGVSIEDLNGDRVPDMLRLAPTTVTFAAGCGEGVFLPPRTITIPGETFDSDQVRKAKFQDITGDGLADLVLERPGGSNQIWYWPNLGADAFDTRKTITNLPVGLGGGETRWADFNGNGTTDLVYCDQNAVPRMQAIDIGELLGCAPAANMLEFIDNGIGRKTHIIYKPSTYFSALDASLNAPWSYPVPSPVNVVASVETSDSLGNLYVTHYKYHEGYYDPVEKQFRGFGRVEQVDTGDASAPTLVTRHYFHTGIGEEAMKGRLMRQTAETESGLKFTDEFTQWATTTLATGTDGVPIRFATMEEKAKDILELGNGDPIRTEQEYDTDGYGNQTAVRDFGTVVNGNQFAGNDERFTTTEFIHDLDRWIVKLPKRKSVGDEFFVLSSREESFYDDESFSGTNFGQVTKGRLTLKRAWINPNAVNSNDPTTFVNASRSTYDAYGNPVALLDPLAVAPAGVLDPSKGHYREIGYDPRFHSFPVSETIRVGNGADNLVFQAAYDEGFGTVSISTDFNGNITTYGYDVFARLVNIRRPYDTDPTLPTIEYDYLLAQPVGTGSLVNWVETRQLDKPAGSQPTHRDHYYITRQFVDGMGRELLSKEEAGPDPQGRARVAVKGAVLFNKRQKPARTLSPYFTRIDGQTLDERLAFEDIRSASWPGGDFHENGTSVTLTLATAHQTAHFYDATLRDTATVNPDATRTLVRYLPLGTDTHDENDTDPFSPFFATPMRHFNDALGRLVRVEELARLDDQGNPVPDIRTWTTQYQYDLNDQLTQITDSQSNVKWMNYDGLKRKTFMNDPDRGVMTYAYDAASNLLETVDAKTQRITYTYDGVNRLLTEDYHDEGLSFSKNRYYDPALPIGVLRPDGKTNQPDVQYIYDVSATDLDLGDGTRGNTTNTAGYLVAAKDLSGSEYTSYDQRGRVLWVVKNIPDPRNRVLTPFRTAFEYDTSDRVTRLHYPDGDYVDHLYDDRRLLREITGGASANIHANPFILSEQAYLPSGQVERFRFGNDVATTQSYDRRLRMNTLRAARLADPQDPLIAYDYTFDPASNITRIDDRRPTSTPGLEVGNKRRNTQLFQYDDLYRLTRADYTFGLPEQGDMQHIAYRYDRIGNMLAQTSNIDHVEKGVSVTHHGAMMYGGGSGTSGRIGRTTEPAGPHALTTTESGRVYPYDANGNMTNIDGKAATWDFKDRLVAIEDDTLSAEYTYDFTDRRIIKRVFAKPPPSVGQASCLSPPVGKGQTSPTRPSSVVPPYIPPILGQPTLVAGGLDRQDACPTLATRSSSDLPTTSTLYIDRYFEIREGDQPTKYVWAGEKRLARVTGSLHEDARRVQRLRLYAGWNLVSIAVDASDLRAQLGLGTYPALTGAFLWSAETGTYTDLLSTSDAVTSGTALWLRSAAAQVMAVHGNYSDPVGGVSINTPGYFCVSGLVALNSTQLAMPSDTALWVHQAQQSNWGGCFGELLPQPAWTGPRFLEPGAPVYIRTAGQSSLEVSIAGVAVSYYHGDHLESSNSVSDVMGRSLLENGYYGFGAIRVSGDHSLLSDPYEFLERETDIESGLVHLGARVLLGTVGSFASTDPLALDPELGDLTDPQRAGPLAYASRRPVVHVDPTGLSDTPYDPYFEAWASQAKEGVVNGVSQDVSEWRKGLSVEPAWGCSTEEDGGLGFNRKSKHDGSDPEVEIFAKGPQGEVAATFDKGGLKKGSVKGKVLSIDSEDGLCAERGLGGGLKAKGTPINLSLETKGKICTGIPGPSRPGPTWEIGGEATLGTCKGSVSVKGPVPVPRNTFSAIATAVAGYLEGAMNAMFRASGFGVP